MPGPAVDLDRQAVGGKREVDLGRAERVAEHPAGDTGLAEQPDEEAFRGGVGAVGGRDEQAPGGGGSGAAHVSAEVAVDGGEADVFLQCAVEEHGAVGERDGGFERGERRSGDADAVALLDVGVVEVAAAQPDAGLGRGLVCAGTESSMLVGGWSSMRCQ